MYNFTGVQNLKSGDITIPVLGYEKKDEYLAKYHTEMAYAMNNSDFNGLTIIVFDNAGTIVMNENWVREIEIAPEEMEAPAVEVDGE